MNQRPWYRSWQVWFCLGLALLWWLVTFPFRFLDWLLSIFR